ncbi:NAD-dependent epimerase/dehydratase [Lachnellula willkommii]|uniref:NAD-dependent epimerase/dehydratase n=1 Tax=Lachnellula willkommii TaxID=215461 RepID=A0A559MLM9_9HELO|nr:NAD-dependent epimerase/dehydratase [Lachnellula willkommii]
MAGELILITGGTGLIGIKTIHTALKAGYSVRAAVRSQAEANAVLAAPTVKAINPGDKQTFVIVPDILADNAYDEAVKGVKYIIQYCLPREGFTPDQYESELIAPAIKGTTSILSAAYKNPGIKRIVITYSVVAIIPLRRPFPAGPYTNPLEAYAPNQIRALLATKEFLWEKKPEWDAINIMPSSVVDDNEMITDPRSISDGTVSAAFAQVLGGDSGWGAVPSTSIHPANIARLHVKALDPKIAGNHIFLAVSEGERGTRWEEAIEIVNRDFPEAVKKGVLPNNNGPATTKRTKVDSSRTEKVFGFKFQSYEEQVKSAVSWASGGACCLKWEIYVKRQIDIQIGHTSWLYQPLAVSMIYWLGVLAI